MLERIPWPELYSDRPAADIPNLEGAIVSGRRWASYQSILGIKPEALKGGTVLNFGSGSSNIGKELMNKGIECQVVDLDLRLKRNHFTFLTTLPLAILRKKFAGTNHRNFVQGHGKFLPFSDHVFDHILALWSTYQIPPEAREAVYAELMRTGDTLHLSPVFGNDYKILRKLAQKYNYQVVACLPIPPNFSTAVPFMFSSPEDYDSFIHKRKERSRIQIPGRDEANVNTLLGMKSPSGLGGNTMVLRRQLCV